MKTVAQILKKTKLGDVLVSGVYKWVIVDKDFDGATIAKPANKRTSFELWSVGVESVAVIPGLKVKR
jgi:hypothetical protein